MPKALVQNAPPRPVMPALGTQGPAELGARRGISREGSCAFKRPCWVPGLCIIPNGWSLLPMRQEEFRTKAETRSYQEAIEAASQTAAAPGDKAPQAPKNLP